MSEATRTFRQEGVVLSPISAGHFLSHYFNTCIPILFPILHLELGLSFTALGFIWTVFNLASGAAQLPVGFLVDHFGAHSVLLVGLVLEGVAILFMGLTPVYGLWLGLAALAGIGNAVFHPADYTILSAKINEKRIGRAFSIHTSAGHLGNAVAPATIGVMVLFFGWQKALIFSGLSALLVVLWLLLMRKHLLVDKKIEKNKKTKEVTEDTQAEGFKSLLSTPMILMFFFFITTSFTLTGITSFSVTVFSELHHISIVEGSTALSGFLFASALGVLTGGFLADRTTRHDLVAVLAFLATGLVMVVLGTFAVHILYITILYVVIGFAQGMVRPSRDMIVRAATPPGGMGKAFGFVSTGIAIGGALAPILFGWLVDQNRPEWVFYWIALFMFLGIFIITASQRSLKQSNA